ncbi:hypothetical protein [Thaumasiovibrio subtropicus]|uniref:hypothetical protein n=1 Tax=Thaumasiovibrio subtropicus TaxID=1891207 RepID=UPI000B3558D6|nr:hypothetical protein [Thaumasiovibrio subtropicus]
MKILVLTLILFPMLSFANPHSDSKVSLLKEYARYITTLNVNNVTDMGPSFLSEDALKETDFSNDFEISGLLFHREIQKTVSVFERIEYEKGYGCLTVNGFVDQNKPISMFFQYTQLDSPKINEIRLEYLEESVAHPHYAKCPHEAEQDFFESK